MRQSGGSSRGVVLEEYRILADSSRYRDVRMRVNSQFEMNDLNGCPCRLNAESVGAVPLCRPPLWGLRVWAVRRATGTFANGVRAVWVSRRTLPGCCSHIGGPGRSRGPYSLNAESVGAVPLCRPPLWVLRVWAVRRAAGTFANGVRAVWVTRRTLPGCCSHIGGPGRSRGPYRPQDAPVSGRRIVRR